MIEEEWKENFRMSKQSFPILCAKLQPFIEKQTTRFRKLISVEKQLAITLYYLTDERRMITINNAFGVAKCTVSNIVRRVCRAISIELAAEYIHCPETTEEFEYLVQNFYMHHGFPQCIGAIDGTHIPIRKPQNNAIDNINRKDKFTLNCI